MSQIAPASPEIHPLVFRFGWDRAEFQRFYRALVRHRTRTLGTSFVLWVPYGFMVLALVYLVAGLAAHSAGAMAQSLPWVLMLGFWGAVLRWVRPSTAARNYQAKTNPYFDPDDMHRVVDADGLEAGAPRARSRLAWPALHKVVETDEFFLFYTSPACAIHLPQRAIPDQATRERLREMVRTHMATGAWALGESRA
jgi:hypothetical protein